MKSFAKGLVATALLSSSLLSANVMAEQKIAVIDVQGVFEAMPQAATIQQDIAAEFKDQTEEVNRIEKDIRYFLEKNQRDVATMSAEEKKKLEEDIIKLRTEYEAKAKPLQQDIQRRVAQERDKLLGLIKQSLDAVAAEGKYDVVLNANAVAYVGQGYDLSEKVLERVSKIN